MELWSEDYFVDLLNRYTKYQIDMFFFCRHERKPTREEYEEYFEKFKEEMKCTVTAYDLGVYD